MAFGELPIGQEIQVTYPAFTVYLTFHSSGKMTFVIREGAYATTETVDIEISNLGNSTFAVSWKESNGAAVVNIQNYDHGLFCSFVALPNGEFWRMKGQMTMTHPAPSRPDTRQT